MEANNLRAHPNWEGTITALLRKHEYLRANPPPIDYQRRRSLNYDNLLPGTLGRPGSRARRRHNSDDGHRSATISAATARVAEGRALVEQMADPQAHAMTSIADVGSPLW